MSTRKASVRKVLKAGTYTGLQIPMDRERRAEIVEVKPTERVKDLAAREDQGLSITVRMPEKSLNRVDLLFQEEDVPTTLSVYLDADKQSDAFAWRTAFDEREDGALILHPSLNGGEIEDYLARRLHESGLLVLRKEGRVVLGAPLFCDGKRDEKDRLKLVIREVLTFALVKAEIERRLVYAPGTEPPPLQIPTGAGGKGGSKSKKKKKPKPPVGVPGAAPAGAGAKSPAAVAAATKGGHPGVAKPPIVAGGKIVPAGKASGAPPARTPFARPTVVPAAAPKEARALPAKRADRPAKSAPPVARPRPANPSRPAKRPATARPQHPRRGGARAAAKRKRR